MKSRLIYKTLRFKLIAGVTVILAVMMGIFFTYQYIEYRSALLSKLADSTTLLSEAIEDGLRALMVANDLNALQEKVEELGGRKGVEEVFVIDKKGEIKFSSDRSEIGRSLDVTSFSCQLCHRYTPENRGKTIVFDTGKGRRIFRNVNPIANTEECHVCHSPQDKLTGVLMADFSMADIEEQLHSDLKSMLLWLFSTLLVTALILSFLINQTVIQRVRRLVEAMRLFGRGDLREGVEPGGDDEIGDLVGSFNWMAERLRIGERERKEAEERIKLLSDAVQTSIDGITLTDMEGNIIFVNEAQAKMLGYEVEELIGENVNIFYRQDVSLLTQREIIEETIENGAWSGEVEVVRKDGEKFPIILSTSLVRDEKNRSIAIVGVAKDITEQKQLQGQLVQSERLAATGKLAAGVAHEINNPAGIILMKLKFLLSIAEEEGLSERALKTLNTVVGQTDRIARITNGLLAFSRQKDGIPTPTDVNRVIEESLILSTHMLSTGGIELHKHLEEDLPLINADPNELEQVMLNLISNAVDAMPEGGRLTITTCKMAAPMGDGWVIIKVEDTGVGIPAEHLPNIFDPFFTTKQIGRGTGLGLSISYGIVQNLGGKIDVASSPGVGSTFTVKLPAVDRR